MERPHERTADCDSSSMSTMRAETDSGRFGPNSCTRQRRLIGCRKSLRPSAPVPREQPVTDPCAWRRPAWPDATRDPQRTLVEPRKGAVWRLGAIRRVRRRSIGGIGGGCGCCCCGYVGALHAIRQRMFRQFDEHQLVRVRCSAPLPQLCVLCSGAARVCAYQGWRQAAASWSGDRDCCCSRLTHRAAGLRRAVAPAKW